MPTACAVSVVSGAAPTAGVAVDATVTAARLCPGTPDLKPGPTPAELSAVPGAPYAHMVAPGGTACNADAPVAESRSATAAGEGKSSWPVSNMSRFPLEPCRAE